MIRIFSTVLIATVVIEGLFRVVYLIFNSSSVTSKLVKKKMKVTSELGTKLLSEDEKELRAEVYAHGQICAKCYGSWRNAIKALNPDHMPDFQGKHFNIRDGIRVTTDQPSIYRGRLLVFGGSTIFCGEVDDGSTICSVLQRGINAIEIPLKVQNYGRFGSTVKNRLNYIRIIKPQSDDIVVLWFGANELGWKHFEHKADIPISLGVLKKFSDGLTTLGRFSFIFQWLSVEFHAHVTVRCFAGYAFNVTHQSLVQLSKLSKRDGFKLIILLQPNLFTKNNLTNAERQIAKKHSETIRGRTTHRMLDRNYPRFKRLDIVSAVHIFDGREDEIFIDWVHLNSVGNSIAARFILDTLRTRS